MMITMLFIHIYLLHQAVSCTSVILVLPYLYINCIALAFIQSLKYKRRFELINKLKKGSFFDCYCLLILNLVNL